MLNGETSVRKTAWILFFGLSACYLALAPGTTDGRGYIPDDLKAGLGLLASFNAWIKGRPVPPIMWTRHGPLPLLLNLPLLKLGKLFVTPDFMLSLEPVLTTAAMLTVAYVWLRKLCTPAMSLLLTLIGAFGTMLWPYAYIGLETKQSLFVLSAAYLGLANGPIRTWSRLLLFSMMCAFAISVKSTGLVLSPAIAYLLYVQFRNEWRSRWKQVLTSLLVIAGTCGLSALGWNQFWAPAGGGAQILVTQWTTDSPFQLFTNLIGIFGSPTKGFFIFAPALLLAIYAIPRAFRTHREIATFALLVTAAMAAFLSILFITADELWGQRFMHVTIAPLLIVIGATSPRFEWRRHVPLLALGLVGVAISFLGAFYYYGVRSWAATAAGQNTLEWLAGDSVWSEVQFDARLFRAWLQGGKEPVYWTPSHWWAWTPPPDAKPWPALNVRDWVDPQSYLLYYWKIQLKGSDLVIFRICLVSLIAGPLLMLWVIAKTIRITPARIVNAAPIMMLRGRKESRTS